MSTNLTNLIEIFDENKQFGNFKMMELENELQINMYNSGLLTSLESNCKINNLLIENFHTVKNGLTV